MLSSNEGCKILDGLFGLLSGTRIAFSGAVYLGLLTRLPNANGAPHEDGVYFTEPTDSNYIRIRLDTKSRINKQDLITPATEGEPVEIGEEILDMAIPAVVENQALIMFPEFMEETVVVGFGLFRSADTQSTTLPFLWGTATQADGEETITIHPEEIPIVRAGGFRVLMA